jgi:hypothetical protein
MNILGRNMAAISYPDSGLTKLECLGDWGRLESGSSVVVFNPWGLLPRSRGGGAGSLAYFFARTLGEHGVGARAASRLALEGFREELERIATREQDIPLPDAIQQSLLKANEFIVQFGKDMGSHGSMLVGCIGLIMRGGMAVVARQGLGGALLHRGERSFPFVESPLPKGAGSESDSVSLSQGPLGAASGLKSDIISVRLQPGDLVGIHVGSDPVASIREIVPAGCRKGGLCVSVGPESVFV